MKTLQFKRPLLRKVLFGIKTQTRRKISYSSLHKPVERYKVGDECVLKTSRYDKKVWGTVKIVAVRTEALGSISEIDALREGFASIEEFRNAWISIYGSYDANMNVHVVTFEVKKVEAVMPDHKDVRLENLRGVAESALSVMRKLVEKPDCYKCRHRGTVPGDCHSSCNHPEALKLHVVANQIGIAGGWFSHPFNFDPRWLMGCDGFEEVDL